MDVHNQIIAPDPGNATAFLLDGLLNMANFSPDPGIQAARNHLVDFMEYDGEGRWIKEPYLEMLCNAVESVFNGEILRLIVTIGPRQGKSQVISKKAPAWYLGNHPHDEIILTSYSADLAYDFSRIARETLRYRREIFPTVNVDKNSSSVAHWTIDGHDGGLVAAGVGGPITGRGANCLPAGTLISTNTGNIDIAALHENQNKPLVLTCDHKSGKLGFKKIVATREEISSELIKITTSAGRKIYSTPDHKYFTESGYREAGSLNVGERLIASKIKDKQELLELWKAEDDQRKNLPRVLSEIKKTENRFSLFLLWEAIHKKWLRIRQIVEAWAQGFLLFGAMQPISPCYQKEPFLFDMWEKNGTRSSKILLTRMLRKIENKIKTFCKKNMSEVLKRISIDFFEENLLFETVCGYGAFRKDDRIRKFKLQGREELREAIPRNENSDTGKRPPHMFWLWKRRIFEDSEKIGIGNITNELNSASHRYGSKKQQSGKPDNSLLNLSSELPQIKYDSISKIEKIGANKVKVYDIQVEGTHNFFANEILVHNCAIIDDPFKNWEEAQSTTVRESVWNWYLSTFRTRLSPKGRIIIVSCMTGDTPVLMADGTERPLCEIKVGDNVATYDNGKLTTATVLNHRSSGHDFVYRIKTTCGKIVHANKRHPFLVEEHGELKWIRLKNLTTAHRIVTVKGNGANGRGRLASSTAVRNLLAHEAIVPHITARRCGQMGIGLRLSTQSTGAIHVSSSDTELLLQNIMRYSQRKMGNVLFANSRQETTYAHIGAANCALTTATKRIQSGDFYVMTAILPWDTPKQKRQQLLLPDTSDFITEQIESIDPVGIKEVFDLQVECTGTFIANGLVSHNTRWHEDDLVGRLITKQDTEDGEEWTVINLPAISESLDDPLGRPIGTSHLSERYPDKEILALKKTLGLYMFNALYQGRPRPEEGNYFKKQWFPRLCLHEFPKDLFVYAAGDFAIDEKTQNDWNALTAVGVTPQNEPFVLDMDRFKGDSGVIVDHILDFQDKWNPINFGFEDGQIRKAIWPIVQDEMKRRNVFVNPLFLVPIRDKMARARALQSRARNGNIIYPKESSTPWIDELVEEMLNFPNGKWDDQVDALAWVFIMLTKLTTIGAGIDMESIAA